MTDRQEQRIQDLVKELVEIKNKDHEDKDKQKSQSKIQLPTIDVKDVKKV